VDQRRAPGLRAGRLLRREREESSLPRGGLRRPQADRERRRVRSQPVGPVLARALAAGVPRPGVRVARVRERRGRASDACVRRMNADSQRAIDEQNAGFWNELCGSGLAQSLGITEITPASLARFDDAYMAFYPYL